MPFVVFKDMNPIVQTVQENSRNLKSIPTWVLEIPTIIRLSLRRNNISLLPTDIAQLSQLKRLDLSENQLYSIPAEVGFLTGLEILQLASNHISALPRTLGKCVNLQGSDKARKSHGAKAASLDGTSPMRCAGLMFSDSPLQAIQSVPSVIATNANLH